MLRFPEIFHPSTSCFHPGSRIQIYGDRWQQGRNLNAVYSREMDEASSAWKTWKIWTKRRGFEENICYTLCLCLVEIFSRSIGEKKAGPSVHIGPIRSWHKIYVKKMTQSEDGGNINTRCVDHGNNHWRFRKRHSERKGGHLASTFMSLCKTPH